MRPVFAFSVAALLYIVTRLPWPLALSEIICIDKIVDLMRERRRNLKVVIPRPPEFVKVEIVTT